MTNPTMRTHRTPPQRTRLQAVLVDLGITQGDLARRAGISQAAMSRLAALNQWPARTTVHVRQAVLACLKEAGAQPRHWMQLRDTQLFARWELPIGGTSKKAPPSCELGEAPCPATPEAPVTTPLEDSMLLERVNLAADARRHFKLSRNPFEEPAHRDQVFASAGSRYVRAALMDAAMHHGFIAIIGESGSGKTTLREELEERIRDEGKPVLLIKPYTLAMEPNDVKGKQMKSGQIAEALAHALAPSVTLKSSPEARFRQVHELLRDSCRAGMRHLLLIEEAHRLPLATLKHLKGWLELKDGLRRLLGVCLIGQPELADILAEQRREIREVVQRCEKVHLPPLDDQLEGYLRHIFGQAGTDMAEVVTPDGIDALRARLMVVPERGRPGNAVSVCYPLVVNNLLARAMQAAARNGWPRVDASVVMGC